MGRSRKITDGERLILGFVIAGTAALCLYSGQPRIGWFIIFAIFVPYLGFLAPFRCNSATTAGGKCKLNGFGILIGCTWHRLDPLRRVFGRTPPSPPRHRRTSRPQPAPTRAPIGQQSLDRLSFMVSVASMVAGLLALFIDPQDWRHLF